MRVLKFEAEKDLDSKSFKTFIENVYGKAGFVLFVYAPWCGACKQMHPEFLKAIKSLGKHKGNIIIISDTTLQHLTTLHSNHSIGKLLSVTVDGFPTLCHVPKADSSNTIRVQKFNESRDSTTISKFIKSSSEKPIIKEKKTALKPKGK